MTDGHADDYHLLHKQRMQTAVCLIAAYDISDGTVQSNMQKRIQKRCTRNGT